MTIRQGHRYSCWMGDVLALESAGPDALVKIARIDESQPYPLGCADHVFAEDLTPLPMRYYHGQVPA